MTFEQWQEFARNIRQRGEALDNSIHERGFEIARKAGIGRDLCCIHNASNDDNLIGWCKGNPERLKSAKKAIHLLNQWPGSGLSSRIISRAWQRVIR